MDGLYTLDELTRSIIDDFQLQCNTDESRNTYRMRIYRALQKLGIWEAGIEQVNPKTKKKCKYFTEHHKQAILSEKTLYDYVRNNSRSDKFSKSKRYDEMQKSIDIRRNEHIKYLDSRTQEHSEADIPVITQEEFHNYKNSMMLTAIFEKFFTPINDELLYNDLYQIQIIKDELNLQIEDIHAEERLQHPNGAYFHDKESVEKT